MRPILLSAVAVCVAACSSPTGMSDPGVYAVVHGIVRSPSGSPRATDSVAVSCPEGGVAATVPTDSLGKYFVHLTGGTLRETNLGVRFKCAFGSPNLVNPVVRVDTTLMFTVPPGMAPFQTVNLPQ